MSSQLATDTMATLMNRGVSTVDRTEETTNTLLFFQSGPIARKRIKEYLAKYSLSTSHSHRGRARLILCTLKLPYARL
jgi:hypothetical protein